MKAAGFEESGGPEKIAIFDVPEPTMGPTSVLVRVEAASLNHFDLLVLAGPLPEGAPRPFWGGGDVSGVVAAVGADVSSFAPGDRVVVNPSLFCGRCEHCVAGEESLCDDYGILGDSRPGGFADRGAKLVPTCHPALLLRKPAKKRECWEDMKLIRRLLDE